MSEPETLSTPGAKSSGVSPYLQNTSAFLDLLMGTQKNESGGSSVVTSGSTDTKYTDVSEEGINNIIRKMFEGTGGLADVATGAKTAGLYGDTGTVSLVQNLLTKIAGTAAEASAKTVSTTGPKSTVATTSNKTTTPPKLTGDALLQTLLMGGASMIGSRVLKKSGLLNAMGLGDSATTTGGATAATGDGGELFSRMQDFITDRAAPEVASIGGDGSSVATGVNALSGDVGASVASDVATSGLANDTVATGIGTLGSATGGLGFATGTGEVTDLAEIANEGIGAGLNLGGEGFQAGNAASSFGGSFASEGSDVVSGVSEGASAAGDALSLAGDSLFGPFSLAADVISGGESGELVGDAAGEFLGGAGEVVSDLLGSVSDASSVVCYELVRTGGMKWEHADASSRFATAHLPENTIKGYHWMCPLLLWLMRHSTICYRIAQIGATARAEELTGSNFLGKIVRIVFEPICFILGCTVGRNAPLRFNVPQALGVGIWRAH